MVYGRFLYDENIKVEALPGYPYEDISRQRLHEDDDAPSSCHLGFVPYATVARTHAAAQTAIAVK